MHVGRGAAHVTVLRVSPPLRLRKVWECKRQMVIVVHDRLPTFRVQVGQWRVQHVSSLPLGSIAWSPSILKLEVHARARLFAAFVYSQDMVELSAEQGLVAEGRAGNRDMLDQPLRCSACADQPFAAYPWEQAEHRVCRILCDPMPSLSKPAEKTLQRKPGMHSAGKLSRTAQTGHCMHRVHAHHWHDLHVAAAKLSTSSVINSGLEPESSSLEITLGRRIL